MYDELAAGPVADREVAASWSAAAKREREHARLLHALAELSVALGDDGPFLVQVPVQLSSLRRVVNSVRGRVSEGVDAITAQRCAEMLDAATRTELHTGLLEVAEPLLKRVLRLIEEETRSGRRRGPRVRRPAAMKTEG